MNIQTKWLQSEKEHGGGTALRGLRSTALVLNPSTYVCHKLICRERLISAHVISSSPKHSYDMSKLDHVYYILWERN